MKKTLLTVTLLASSAFASVAHADITGQVWINTAASFNAQASSLVGLGTPDATFTAPSNILNFASPPGSNTIGGFIATDGGTCVGNCGASLQNTIFNITGLTTVSMNQSFTGTHDDGMSFYINGQTI